MLSQARMAGRRLSTSRVSLNHQQDRENMDWLVQVQAETPTYSQSAVPNTGDISQGSSVNPIPLNTEAVSYKPAHVDHKSIILQPSGENIKTTWEKVEYERISIIPAPDKKRKEKKQTWNTRSFRKKYVWLHNTGCFSKCNFKKWCDLWVDTETETCYI